MTERLSDERLDELRHRRCGCHYTKPHLCDGCAIRALVDEVRERRAAELPQCPHGEPDEHPSFCCERCKRLFTRTDLCDDDGGWVGVCIECDEAL